jgi:hypothetical protein
MLKLVWLSESKGQKELWSQFNPSKQRWIVSDAKTKYFLNQSLLEKHDIINEPVKRAKEFWKELFKTQNYDFRIDNDLGTKITAKEFLKIYGKSEWCARPHAPERLIDAARNLGTLTTQDNADEILAQYSSEFNESESTFVELAKLSIDFYHFCIEKKNLPTFFLPFYLARNPERLSGEKELVFDLGIDLRDGERELIQELSKINDVTVIIPCGNKDQLEARGLYAYRNFELGLIQVENKNVESLSSNPNFKLWRCSSPEAEARQAVEQVRKWVSEGIDPSEICIAAPQIADYDDILHHDLIWEGIGFQRTLKAPLSSTRIFRAFQARLKIILGQIESGVLEEAFLSVGSYHQHTQRRLERRILKPVVDEIQVPQEEIKSEISKLRKLYFSTPQSVHQFEKVLITVFKSI